MIRSFARRAAIAALAFTAACGGDAVGPAIELTEDQLDDMLDAFAASGAFDMVGAAPSAGIARAIVTETVEATEQCPNGGTTSMNGTMTLNDQTESFTLTFTQGFSGCKGTSSTGRLWTFDGDPHISTTINASYNQSTTVYTISGSQTGAIKAASDIGSGRCAWNVTFSFSENETTGAVNGTMSGTVCGRTIEVELTEEGEPGV